MNEPLENNINMLPDLNLSDISDKADNNNLTQVFL